MSFWRLARIGLLAVALGLVAAAGTYAQERTTEPDEPRTASDGQLVYAFMNGSNSIAVIELAGRSVADRIAVDGNPHGGAITPDGRIIYTANMGGNEIYVVDAQSGRTIDSIEMGGISHHSVVSPDGRYLYVAADQVVVIDTARNEVVARIASEESPFDLGFTPDGRLLYALAIGSSIAVIDPATNAVVDTIRMPASSIMGHMAFRPDGKELYVTNDPDDMVTVVDVTNNRPVVTIRVGPGPHGVATTADGRYVIVANRGGTTFSVIDTRRRDVVATREVGQRPEHVTAAPDSRFLLMSVNTGANKILMIDPVSFDTLAAIDVWSAPHTLVFSEAARRQKTEDNFVLIETSTTEGPAAGKHWANP